MFPETTREDLIKAMRRFDADFRTSEIWAEWETNKAYKFAIEESGRRYPVKKIVSLATGMPVSDFSGGKGSGQANEYVEARGFRVVQLTGGHNPAWMRDELILALDLYLSKRPNPPGNSAESVIQLSILLNKLAERLGVPNYDRYRNPNGVGMKLMNFRALDPTYTSTGGKGLNKIGKGDKEVWDEFAPDPERCRKVAETIRAAIEDAGSGSLALQAADEDCEAPEGRLLTVLHQRRERNRKIVEKKKKKVLSTTGRLQCEACQFDFSAQYGERGVGFIECHHTRPLAEASEQATTKLDDLALLCANCHRMIHVRSPWLSVEEIRMRIIKSQG